MRQRKYKAALEAIAQLGLGEANARLARLWLSLWRDGEPPRRNDFHPAMAQHFLPGLTLLEVASGGDIGCRLAGTAVDAALGFALTGKSLLSFLPPSQRPLRQSRFIGVVDGAVAVARTVYQSPSHGAFIMENLHLPFAGQSVTGSRKFLLHTNIRPTRDELYDRPEKWNAGLPDEFIAASFA